MSACCFLSFVLPTRAPALSRLLDLWIPRRGLPFFFPLCVWVCPLTSLSLAEKSLLSTFRIGRKDEDPGAASSGSSPFGGRKAVDKEKEAASSSHPFGPPRRSGAESASSSNLADAGASGSPQTKRRVSGADSSKDQIVGAVATRDESETDDTESVTSSSSTKRLSVDGGRMSGDGSPAPQATPPPPLPSASAPQPAAKVLVIVSQGGHSHEFEYASDWQVRAVMANLATKLTVDKNASLYHPTAHVYLEPQREILCYWDTEPAPLTLALVTTKAPSTKEVKVKLGQIKRTVHVLKTTTASGVVMAAGEDTGFHPTVHALLVNEKPVAPNTVVWKLIGSEWAVVPVAEMAAVNLRVHFVDEQVFKVLKVAASTTVRGMIEACRKKWIVKMQDGSAVVEFGFWLKEDSEWLSDDTPAYALSDRADLEFKRKVPAAAAAAAPGTPATPSTGTSEAALALGGASGSAAPPSVLSPGAPLTEKAKKARREKIEKEVALFLQRRPPNSAPSNLKSDASKRKPIDCTLNYDVIDYCLGFLEKQNVLDLEGIYRISGNSDTVRHVWAAFCLGHFDYLEWQDTAGEIAHVVTGACKLYLRELEVPLLPWDTHQKFLACESMTDPDAKLAAVAELVGQLNAVSQHTLRRLTYHLWDVAAFEKVNRMSPGNLAIVFGPTIMRPEVQDIAEMLNNATKVDLCTYMILNREKLFDLEKLKPMTERMLGPMPVLEESKPAKSTSLRKAKSTRQSIDELGAAPAAEAAASPVVPPKGATIREPKKTSIGTALQGAGARKTNNNPRAYNDAISAMMADLMPEVVAGCMVFQRQMEVDPKAFRKHLKNLAPDQLIDLVQNLAKHVTAAPAGSGPGRMAKTITVGAAKTVPVGAASVPPPATVAVGASPELASEATPEPVAKPLVDEPPPPRPVRPPPSLVAAVPAPVEDEEEEEVDELVETEDVMAVVAAGIAAAASAALESDGSPVKADEPAPRSRALSVVDLTTAADDSEDELVIGVAPAVHEASVDEHDEEEIVIVSVSSDDVVLQQQEDEKQQAETKERESAASEQKPAPAAEEDDDEIVIPTAAVAEQEPAQRETAKSETAIPEAVVPGAAIPEAVVAALEGQTATVKLDESASEEIAVVTEPVAVSDNASPAANEPAEPPVAAVAEPELVASDAKTEARAHRYDEPTEEGLAKESESDSDDLVD